jgi:hypothetical protein
MLFFRHFLAFSAYSSERSRHQTHQPGDQDPFTPKMLISSSKLFKSYCKLTSSLLVTMKEITKIGLCLWTSKWWVQNFCNKASEIVQRADWKTTAKMVVVIKFWRKLNQACRWRSPKTGICWILSCYCVVVGKPYRDSVQIVIPWWMFQHSIVLHQRTTANH